LNLSGAAIALAFAEAVLAFAVGASLAPFADFGERGTAPFGDLSGCTAVGFSGTGAGKIQE